jgi:hypothetical protein
MSSESLKPTQCLWCTEGGRIVDEKCVKCGTVYNDKPKSFTRSFINLKFDLHGHKEWKRLRTLKI